MKRRMLIVIGIVILGVAVWAWLSVSQIMRAQTDLSARFEEVVQYYAGMRTLYVEPLLNLPMASDGDRQSLQSISSHLTALGQTSSVDQQYTDLIAVQHEIIGFFAAGPVGEGIAADSHFIEWNTNATSRGQVSTLLHEYNQALKTYNVAMRGLVGQVVDRWSTHWQHTQYLGIDGTTQESTQILF